MAEKRWPTEIRLTKDKRSLHVAFDDGASFELPAEYLRVTSPSAEVQGHSPSERKTVPGKRNVEIIGIEPVGNYAVRLRFDDMHDTGIFGWDYLHELYLCDSMDPATSSEPGRRSGGRTTSPSSTRRGCRETRSGASRCTRRDGALGFGRRPPNRQLASPEAPARKRPARGRPSRHRS